MEVKNWGTRPGFWLYVYQTDSWCAIRNRQSFSRSRLFAKCSWERRWEYMWWFRTGFKKRPILRRNFWCTGSWEIFAWVEGQLGDVPLERSATWGRCQLGDFNLSDSLGTISYNSFLSNEFNIIYSHKMMLFLFS